MRLDLLLVRLRFAPSRNAAQDWIAKGHMRRNSQRVAKANQPIACGDVLTLPMRDGVRLIEILALPDRRGPASEAQSHYRVLDAGRNIVQAPSQGPKPQVEGPHFQGPHF